MTPLSVALHEIGVKEHPAGSNDGPRVHEYQAVTGAYRAAWCASFVQWCLKQAGCAVPAFGRSAYVPYILSTAKAHGMLVNAPKPGDIVCFDWERDGVADHIGFVLKVIDHRTFETVEGNTAVGNDSNGGEVMRRTRNVSEVAGFIRLPDKRPAWVKRAEALTPLWAWITWRDHGAPAKLRPRNIPTRVPKTWWARYALHVGARRKKS